MERIFARCVRSEKFPSIHHFYVKTVLTSYRTPNSNQRAPKLTGAYNYYYIDSYSIFCKCWSRTRSTDSKLILDPSMVFKDMWFVVLNSDKKWHYFYLSPSLPAIFCPKKSQGVMCPALCLYLHIFLAFCPNGGLGSEFLRSVQISSLFHFKYAKLGHIRTDGKKSDFIRFLVLHLEFKNVNHWISQFKWSLI